MKKLLTIALVIAMIATMAFLTGCGSNDTDSYAAEEAVAETTVSEVINVAALNGPTGMGVVRLMDMTDKYNVETYQAAMDVVPKLIAGDVDIACLPSNMAAVLYNKTEGNAVMVSPMVMGVLYIVGNGTEGIENISDLKGKTIISAGQGGTPEYALQKIMESAGLTIYEDVDVQWLSSHADVNAKLLSEEGTIAMVPEPFVSTALTKGGDKVVQLFDLNDEWEKATGKEFPMGVLVARRDFVENKAEDLDVFLTDLQSSIDEVNSTSDEICQLLVEKELFGDAAIAKKAIPNCNLRLYAGDNASEGAEIVKTFNEILYEMNPQAVGGALPGDDMYY